MNEQQNKAEQALLELVWNNPLRDDRHAYELRLALWGLGLIDERPSPAAFGVDLGPVDNSNVYPIYAYAQSIAISHHE